MSPITRHFPNSRCPATPPSALVVIVLIPTSACNADTCDTHTRAAQIATYALCGFANFPSIAIQIGGLSAIAPGRRSDFATLGLRTMFGGAIASWMTATIAGLFLPPA